MSVRGAMATILAAWATGVLGTAASAAVVFPVKEYAKPDEAIVVRFTNEKGDEGKKAVEELGAMAGKVEGLFAPATAADVVGDQGSPLFKIFTDKGQELKVGSVKVSPEATVDISAACPDIKGGGTYFLVWKDAPPLVIETLYNPGRGKRELEQQKGRIDMLSADDKKMAMAQYAPAVTHIEMAQYAQITTDKGVIKAKFAYDVAPYTADNFMTLARQNFYDNSAFHRIISGFMIQGGDAYANMESAGMGGPGYEIKEELSDKHHVRGVLSMAKTNEPNTTGSQFFIMHGDNSRLDGGYSAFGDVFDGMNVVDEIAKTPVADTNGKVSGPKPKIVSIRILPATAEIYGLKK
jgi:peptidyl-prolyl cis-trans isomerase B (cyclophilin B)